MCGICGIWNDPNPEITKTMISAMYHRGPDDKGAFCDEKVSLGMARLAVIDVNPTGHQPMSNREKTIWIVYNGEVYNHLSERAMLEKKGHRFVSTSDTEVILRLYEEYGDDFLLRLRGMFALAIYDLRGGRGKERLLLARDQLGIKPLLYSEQGNRLVFASEIKTLLASRLVSREIEPESLRLLLTFGSIYQPKTILRDVKMLLPGHRLVLENGRPRIERYWSLGTGRRSEVGRLPYEEQVGVLREALQESVRLQMISDVPLGAFLSGGVDSSIMVAMMTAAAQGRVKTFSVGFEQEGKEIDETQDALKTATFLGTDHHHVIVRGQEVGEQILQIATALDQPTVDGVNSYFISQAARQHVTVAVSGTGGDELFAGYPWYVNMLREAQHPLGRRARLAATLARWPIFGPLMNTKWNRQLHQIRTQAGFLSRYALQHYIFGSLQTMDLLAPAIRREAHVGTTEAADLRSNDELPAGSTLERVTALCLRGYTTNQLLRDIDATSMSHSLEVRVPYLDVEMVDLALSLPDESKILPPQGMDAPLPSNTYRAMGVKRILVDAGRPFLPKDFDIQPKRGFGMPFDSWLRGPLQEILRNTLSEAVVRRRGWLSPRRTQIILNEFESQERGWIYPWLLMMVELWARENLDK